MPGRGAITDKGCPPARAAAVRAHCEASLSSSDHGPDAEDRGQGFTHRDRGGGPGLRRARARHTHRRLSEPWPVSLAATLSKAVAGIPSHGQHGIDIAGGGE